MAVRDWLRFPVDDDGWGRRADGHMDDYVTQINANLTAIALNTAHRERQEPSNGYLWESDTTTEYLRVQGEQGGSSNRIRMTAFGDGDSGEAFEFYWNSQRFMLVNDTDIVFYSDDGGTVLMQIERDNDTIIPVAEGALTLGTNITDWGGSWETNYYRKSPMGQVTCTGLLKNSTGGAITSGYVLATLPTGARPSGSVMFICPTGSSSRLARVQVNSSGQIVFEGATSLPNNQYISIAPINFYV